MSDLDKYLLQDDETFEDWKFRIIFGKLEKIIDLDWVEIVELLGLDCSADHLRKTAYGAYEYYKYSLDKKKNKLENIRERIGELNIIKAQTQYEKNQLAKIRRELVKSVSIADELKDYMKENGFTVIVPEYCKQLINTSNKDYEMVLTLSDFHIGYIIDNCKGNSFNWGIANSRVNNLIDKCYSYIKLYNIKKVYVINLGDMIEHVSMRKNQSQFCEFNQAEQINKAIEIIYRILIALCKYCEVEYDSVYGNHDRMNGEKEVNLDGDNSETIIREQLSQYNKLSNNKRLKIINRKHNTKEIKKQIMGLNCKFLHGDKNKKGTIIFKNEISIDNEFYDLIFKGHLHNFKVESENHGRYIISNGCLSGYNDYSLNFGSATVASQTITVLKYGEIEIIKDVQL